MNDKLDALFDMYANLHDELKSHGFLLRLVEDFADQVSYRRPGATRE